jgi:hypothetical protein
MLGVPPSHRGAGGKKAQPSGEQVNGIYVLLAGALLCVVAGAMAKLEDYFSAHRQVSQSTMKIAPPSSH